MKYIDKHQHLQAGHAITDDYLDQECRIDDGNEHYCYQNVDYEGSFGSSGAKSKMQQLALNSQENYCCYCMRDLHMQNQQVTLEHIIPQSCSAAELVNYTRLNVSPLTDDEVVLTSSFTQVTDIHVPPRPHTVTFENLTASCDGTFPDKEGTSQCCNHYRGCKFVYPLFFEVDVEEKIVYRENGAMQPKNGCPHSDEYRKTIENVRLNCQNLMDIRRLWHLFANVDQNELVACLSDRNLRMKLLMRVLYQDVAMLDQDNSIQRKFMKDQYWRTFLLYHWFSPQTVMWFERVQKQQQGDPRDAQAIAVAYNDTVIYPDKVRLNCYYYRNYSFWKDIKMIFCTVLGRKMEYAGERI